MLTVVLPTKNRSSYLIRALSYYHKLGLSHRLIIADSSAEDQVSRVKSFIHSLKPGLEIEYQIFDRDIPPQDKIAQALRGVDTAYAVLAADDDFFVLKTLDQAVQFLKDHPDYSVVHGDAVRFSVGPEAVYGHVTEISSYPQRAVEYPKASERLLDHLSNFTTTYYSVEGVEALQKNWAESARLQVDNYFLELIPSCLSLVQGKAKKITGLYMARQASPIKEYIKKNTFEWITQKEFSVQYERFRDCIARELSFKDGINLEDSLATVDQAMWAYIASWLTTQYSCELPINRRPVNKVSLFFNQVLRKIPGTVTTCRALKRIFENNPKKNLADDISLPKLLNGSLPYDEDFLPINRVIAGNSH